MTFLRNRLLEIKSAVTFVSTEEKDDDEHIWHSTVADFDDHYEATGFLLSASLKNSTSSSSAPSKEWRLMSGSTEDIVVSCLMVAVIVLSLIIIYLWIRSEIYHSKRLRLRRSGSIRNELNRDNAGTYDYFCCICSSAGPFT